MSHAYSRRQILRGVPTCVAVVMAMVSAAPRTALGQQKATKAMVQYQESPKAGHQCSSCSNFVSPNSCKVVGGPISPHGWCAIWTPKSA